MRLNATDIHAGYGKIEVLHGATIRADEGEIICIIGPNGSGKSTLLKAIFGLLKPTKGTVSFNGTDITRLEPEQKVRLGIAFIPQGRNVFPSLSVRENLEMGERRWMTKRRSGGPSRRRSRNTPFSRGKFTTKREISPEARNRSYPWHGPTW